MTHRTRSPFWPAAGLVSAVAASWWWWPSFDDAVPAAPTPPFASAATPVVAPAPGPATPRAPIVAAAKPVDAVRSASPFKLIGTVKAANSADSFALVRRTSDSQLVRLRAGDRIEGLTVSAIESDSVVLAGVAHAVVIEADATAANPAPAVPVPAAGGPAASQEEPAWAGHPAPFGH